MELHCVRGEKLSEAKVWQKGKPFDLASKENPRRIHHFEWLDGKPIETLHYYFPDD